MVKIPCCAECKALAAARDTEYWKSFINLMMIVSIAAIVIGILAGILIFPDQMFESVLLFWFIGILLIANPIHIYQTKFSLKKKYKRIIEREKKYPPIIEALKNKWYFASNVKEWVLRG
jgi:hypothetical protein